MRVATWNINGLRARLDFLLHWLNARQPDVVGLQELKLEDEKFPRDELAAAGYRVATHGQKSWNGVAVVTREPAEVVQIGLPGQEELGARLLTVKVSDLVFTTVYCPNGKNVEHEDYPRKLAWYESLGEHLASNHDPDQPGILCGDFNICPAAIDSWNESSLTGHIFHTEAERERFSSLLGWGYVDLFRHLHPDLQKFSWWDYRAGAFHKNMGLRTDFLLGTRPVSERVETVETDRDYRKKKDGLIASDHAPVIAELR